MHQNQQTGRGSEFAANQQAGLEKSIAGGEAKRSRFWAGFELYCAGLIAAETEEDFLKRLIRVYGHPEHGTAPVVLPGSDMWGYRPNSTYCPNNE